MKDRIRLTVTRFFAKFDTVPRVTLAEKLGVAEKTLQRLRDATNEPSDGTLRRMLELIEQHDAEAMASDSDRLMRAEQIRANHEKQQREIALPAYEDKREKRYPRWFDRVKGHIKDEKYLEAIDAILDHRDDKATWSHIDKEATPYILHTLGVAYYRTGRNLEALEASEAALADLAKGGRNSVSSELQAWCLIIKGLSLMRLWRTREAFAAFEEAILMRPETDGAYYNALCCASLLKAQDLVGLWAGRYIEAVSRFELEDINDVLSRVDVDKDLVFFRELPIIEDFKARLLKERSGRSNRNAER